jgi:calcineurin-like phosphoesterase family protein
MNWFSSDHHFWHRNVITYEKRPYSLSDDGVLQMNEDMISKWNEVVKPDDVVYYLGDFSLSHRAAEVYTGRLNGYKILIQGNHDWGHPAHKKSRTVEGQNKWRANYLKWGWDEIHTELEIFIGPDDIRVRLHHMPYLDENDPNQNHKKFRLKDDGVPLICGHVHSRWANRLSKRATPQVNVGVDVRGFYPINEDKVMELFKYLVSPEYNGPEVKNLNLTEESSGD